MSKITVFFGGSVGSDPKSPKTWSGSGVFLFYAVEKPMLRVGKRLNGCLFSRRERPVEVANGS
jgi:hypothetical protein